MYRLHGHSIHRCWSAGLIEYWFAKGGEYVEHLLPHKMERDFYQLELGYLAGTFYLCLIGIGLSSTVFAMELGLL